MKQRLLELLNDYRNDMDIGSWGEETLADYLLANGVIVPPVKVGQKVYIIGWCGDIEEFTVRDVHICTNEKGDCLYRFRAVIGEKSDIHFTTHYIGDTVFLTREEAEKALAERGGE